MRSCFYWILFSVFWLPAVAVYGQSTSFQHIEKQVYAYNNALKYKQSQALLLPILDNTRYSADEHYQAAILLSYTYKRVQDYATTIEFLDKAQQLALRTTQPSANRARVLGQKAFAYFDIHKYKRANALMQQLERTHFQYINQEDKAKLVHQQGYLLFLDKKYDEAEATYDKALIDLRTASSCDVPMILVKKMQLYAAMNRMDLANDAFTQSNQYADSCGILKYRIYACSELMDIYKERRDMANVAIMATIVDSLDKVYARAENIATLHNQKEAISQQASHRTQNQLVLLLSAMGLTVALLVAGLLVYRKRQQRLVTERERIRVQLEQYVATNQASSPPVLIEQASARNLSERQRQVLAYLVEGRSNREIADLIYVSENTVKYHIKNIYEELAIKNRKELLTRMRSYRTD